MANDRHLYLLVGGLILAALGIFLFKYLLLGFPLTPNKQVDRWDVEARIAFTGQGRPIKLYLYLPQESERYTIIDDNFLSRGYGLNIAYHDGNRQLVWSRRSASGPQVLYYRTTVRRLEPPQPTAETPAASVPLPQLSGASKAAAEALAATIRAQSADLDTLVAELLRQLNASPPDAHVTQLLGRGADPIKRLQVAVEVLAYSGLRARIAHGIRLQEMQRAAPLLHWLEVYDGHRWRAYDPSRGTAHLPGDYLTWWHGAQPLAHLHGGRGLDTRLSVSLNKEAALNAVTARSQRLAPAINEFSLYGLPIETQVVYHILLMIPIGAFILVVLRNVVGVKTFGTFMPVLIALAFRETQLLWGVMLFSLIVALGLTVRFYLERLKLLLVPRLAAVLIIVVLLMAVLSVLSHKLGLHQGLSIALFPMVILTMTIERMSIVWEERGASEALQQGLGSLAVAALAYLVMRQEPLQHLIFLFPELLLLLLGLVLLLGRYSGYRLTELWRFKVLARDRV